MFCPRCGREAASDAAFCSYCGARLPVAAGVAPSTGDPAAEPRSDPSGGPAVPSAAPATAVPPGWESPPPAWQPPPPAWQPTPAATPAVEVRYGGFWRRFGAFLIDGTLLWIAGALLRLGMGADVFETDWNNPRSTLSDLISLIGGWLYCALLESSTLQGTLGQRAAGLKVTDLAHRRISFLRATGRHFAQIASVLTLGIGYLMIAFTAKKQALHDIIAGCVIIRAD